MKTLTAIFFALLLGATGFSGPLPKEAANNATKITHKSNAKTITTKSFLLTCMGRYTSYFRSFMPYDEDPCNHTPSGKTFC